MTLLSNLSGRLGVALVSAALTLPLWSTPAHADALSIVDTTTQVVLDAPVADLFNTGAIYFAGKDFWTEVSGVLNSPVQSITVDGQGPGPIEVHWAQDLMLLSEGIPAEAINLRNFVLSAADQTIYVDATFAVAQDQQSVEFTRLPFFSLQNLAGDVDGGSLLQAVASPTFAPQQVRLSASVFINPEAAYALMSHFIPDVPPASEWPVMYVGTLAIQPVPEPATWASMGLGLAGIMAVASRRRRAIS